MRILSAATVDNLSSQRHIGTFVAVESFVAKDLVDWHLGPSLPFILIGKPRTIPWKVYLELREQISSRS